MLLSKSDDPYLALMNYRSTPLQQGQSPAELLMGRKIGTRVLIFPEKLVPKGGERQGFRKIDAAFRQRQKQDYDRRHCAKPMSDLSKGQPVWVKTPRDAKATVVERSRDRSYLLKTDNGLKVRNRHQIRLRTEGDDSNHLMIPRESSMLPHHQPELPAESLESDTTLHDTSTTSDCITKSGRHVRPPQRLDM
ncbi:uncharacterized protein LOC106012956 [Aplysia californica]|uniref:Uncharacterized protein LOC106012956 n=1 Tax=Aplysia californica TaxID=6500 RepID=A0ABM1A8H1_APLCA|nr:uncharacterized protein LOC106012956 [Aplysia californica]